MNGKTFGTALTALLLGIAGPASGGDGLVPGEPFPGLVLPSMRDGSPGSISDFRGEKVFLHVFASW